MTLLAAAIVVGCAAGAVVLIGLLSSSSRLRDPLIGLAVLAFVLEVDVEPLAGATIDSARDLVVAAAIVVSAATGWWMLRDDRWYPLRTPLVYLLAIPAAGFALAPWSLDPLLSASKSVATFALILVVSIVVARRGFVDALEVLVFALAILVTASVLMTFLGISGASLDGAGDPDTGIAGLSRYGGLAGNPNALGRAAALCAVGGAVLLRRGRGRLPVVGEMIGCGGLLFAQSRTSLVVAAVMLVVVHLGLGHKRAVAGLVGFGAVAVSWILVSSGSVVDLITRDGGGTRELATGTGRTVLWKVAWALAWERPIIGHGAFGSEQVLEGAVSTNRVPFEASDAHNLLLNLFLTQGLIAVGLVAALVGSVISARPRLRRCPDPRLVLLGTFVLLSIPENTVRKPGAALMVVSAAVASLTLSRGFVDDGLVSSADPVLAVR